MNGELRFPDAPRSELERTVNELVTHARAVLRTQGRLRNLLAANRRIVEHLNLEDTLRAVVEAGVELVGARHGSLRVVGLDGALERTIRAEKFDLGGGSGDPAGDREPLVVPVRADVEARSPDDLDGPVGWHALLVPIRVRDTAYGTLHLADPIRGSFTEEDRDLATALAATASVAIDNARLFADAQLREHWTTAIADVTAALLADDELDDVLTMIVDRVAAFIQADVVCIVLPITTESVRVAVATGNAAESVRGQEYRSAGSLVGRAMTEGHAVSCDLVASGARFPAQPAFGPAIALPLRAFQNDLGVLIAARASGGARFSETEMAMADDFGRQTSVLLAVARSRRDRRRLERTEDRNRIARDLHDHVIQRLFAAGLALQAATRVAPDSLRDRLDDQVSSIDAAIGEIRTAVFALGVVDHRAGRSVRDRVLDVVAEIGPALTVLPRLAFTGPVDFDVEGDLADDVVAVIRESLTNVARHARDARCRIGVATVPGAVRVVVTDDGPGPGVSSRRSGTANLAARAELRGGTYSVDAGRDGGTEVTWTVPLPTAASRSEDGR
jgi:signal transduction histidine kinase